MKKTQAEKITKLLESIDIDISQDEIKDFDTLDEITEYLEENSYFDVEIIYYSNAMEYLSENDTSLRESLEIASEMGFDPKNLSSEILASLLASQKMREEYQDITNEIEEILE